MSTSTDRRLWRCPSCGKTYRIPADKDDPAVCPECETPVNDKHTPPEKSPSIGEVLSRPLPRPIVAGLAILVLSLYPICYIVSLRETKEQKFDRENERQLAEINAKYGNSRSAGATSRDGWSVDAVARVNVWASVKANVKHPHTAKFGWVTFSPVDGGTKYATRSYVESQNDFGAKIRTNFLAICDSQGNVVSLVFE